MTRRYGLLLPHFGEHASRHNLVEGARRAERYGFDSVWVRDHEHLVFDLRFRFDQWLECLAILGEEVLPELRRLDTQQSIAGPVGG